MKCLFSIYIILWYILHNYRNIKKGDTGKYTFLYILFNSEYSQQFTFTIVTILQFLPLFRYADLVRDVRQNKGSILRASVQYIKLLKQDQVRHKD